MSIAKKLIEHNIEVTIYEKNSKVGGMTQTIKVGDITSDKYYRHLFKSDKYLIELTKELQIEIKWFKSKMGYYIQNQLYDWGQPITLLTFKPLNLLQKIKFGMSVIKIKLIKNWKELEKYTIKEWFEKNQLQDVYNIIWKPLLNNKFGAYASSISMAWLWGKINLRKTDSSFNKEVLGYIENFEEMNSKMQKDLTQKGVKFYLDTQIQDINKINDKYIINQKEEQYDIVISTLSYLDTKHIFKKYLTKEEIEKLTNVKYIAAKTMLIESRKRLTKYYWLNIADDKFPFCGIIDYHNMEKIENKDMIYISNYLEVTNSIYQLTPEEVLQKYLPYIQKINKDFKKEDILNYKIIDEKYAQPIIEPEYSKMMLDYGFNQKGLYINTLPQIYPEDRGVNYAIRNGYKLANEIIKKFENHK